jgi:ComF family protein
VKKAITSIKYRFASDVGSAIVNSIDQKSLQTTASKIPLSSIVVPIPLYPARLRERGFNQAELLGRLVAARLNLSMRQDILKRVKNTVAQVAMKKKEDRLTNMKDVFAIQKNEIDVHSIHTVVLFDDVFTTGATMRSAARTLKKAGVSRVWAMTIAR